MIWVKYRPKRSLKRHLGQIKINKGQKMAVWTKKRHIIIHLVIIEKIKSKKVNRVVRVIRVE